MHWTLTHHDGVALLEYARPPRNFMSFLAMGELGELLRELAGSGTTRVVVLASSLPGYFVAHGDLVDLGAVARGDVVDGDPTAWFSTLRFIEAMPQPVIAAIDGQAWGGGCELALAATLRLASPRAHFAQPEIDLGIIPGAGGTVRLPRIVGAARAAEMIMTGRIVDAEEALRIGLVNAVLAGADFRGQVLAWAQTLAAKPETALQAAKAVLADNREAAPNEALRNETAVFLQLQRSDAARERQEAALQRYLNTPASDTVVLG